MQVRWFKAIAFRFSSTLDSDPPPFAHLLSHSNRPLSRLLFSLLKLFGFGQTRLQPLAVAWSRRSVHQAGQAQTGLKSVYIATQGSVCWHTRYEPLYKRRRHLRSCFLGS